LHWIAGHDYIYPLQKISNKMIYNVWPLQKTLWNIDIHTCLLDSTFLCPHLPSGNTCSFIKNQNLSHFVYFFFFKLWIYMKYSNIASFFRFVNKRTSYPFGWSAIVNHFTYFRLFPISYLRNKKSWKPECVGSFNMDWRILVFYPEPEVRDKIY
jgi:hypothetical protein